MIKGTTVILYDKTETGRDALNAPIYTETAIQIDNVLIEPVSGQEAIEALDLTGRRAVYRLHIPKTDTHQWENRKVSFRGEDWLTFGTMNTYMPENTPTAWNKSIQVERYGQDEI